MSSTTSILKTVHTGGTFWSVKNVTSSFDTSVNATGDNDGTNNSIKATSSTTRATANSIIWESPELNAETFFGIPGSATVNQLRIRGYYKDVLNGVTMDTTNQLKFGLYNDMFTLRAQAVVTTSASVDQDWAQSAWCPQPWVSGAQASALVFYYVVSLSFDRPTTSAATDFYFDNIEIEVTYTVTGGSLLFRRSVVVSRTGSRAASYRFDTDSP